MQAPFVLVEKSQKQKDQYRSYVIQKLDEESCPVVDDNTSREELDTWKESREKGTWIEQSNEQGKIFTDSYLHPRCEYIKNIKIDGTTTN